MVDLTKLRVKSLIETGVMVFEPDDENDFSRIELEVVDKFDRQNFSRSVTLINDDDVFLHLKLLAGTENLKEFEEACEWLIKTVEDLGGHLEFVS